MIRQNVRPRYIFSLYIETLTVLCLYFENQKVKKKKDKKSKKEKGKVKKEKKKEKKKLKDKRSEYEEADGTTTPSKETISLSQQPTPNDVKLPVSFFSGFFFLFHLQFLKPGR